MTSILKAFVLVVAAEDSMLAVDWQLTSPEKTLVEGGLVEGAAGP
jgi:hypothetical protein